MLARACYSSDPIAYNPLHSQDFWLRVCTVPNTLIMLGPNGLQSHRICKRFYIARRAKVRPVGLYKAKSSTGVSLLTICISLYKAFSSFVYSCYCITLSRRHLLLKKKKKKMAVGGCFCGKVRIEYSGQPIATVSVPIYNP